ncbi:MAG TPA: hypothetical protein EYG93_00360 [Sulfurospirillum arcachonense]|nr:hypothetical protein [Sulfurospirillum arcachonense]HIP43776.1 hypothetical protein [Sulfurospirillum arcachonense]
MISPLFSLIPNNPGIYISIIEDKNFECVDELKQYANSINATLHVNEFNFEQKRYTKHAVQYDFLFICADIDRRNDILEIANKTYRVLKNAGHVFVLSKKESTCRLSDVFEESNFVAINTISLDDEYDVISAKKMHGWMKV